jgi:hypothetical protein
MPQIISFVSSPICRINAIDTAGAPGIVFQCQCPHLRAVTLKIWNSLFRHWGATIIEFPIYFKWELTARFCCFKLLSQTDKREELLSKHFQSTSKHFKKKSTIPTSYLLYSERATRFFSRRATLLEGSSTLECLQKGQVRCASSTGMDPSSRNLRFFWT